MGVTGTENSWEQIRQGVGETERLIGQRQYNLAMIKARSTLEFMVKCLAERASIYESDLNETIDALYDSGWINKSTFEHYHKIRTIGNKAVHDGYDNAYDANQAYHMLSQEVYLFSNSQSTGRRSAPVRRNNSDGVVTNSVRGNSLSKNGASTRVTAAKSGASAARTGTTDKTGSTGRTGISDRTSSAGKTGTANRTGSAGRTTARSSSSGNAASRNSYSSKSRRQQRRRRGLTPYDLLKLLIPIFCIVLLIVVIKLIVPSGETEPETTAPTATETVAETAAPETVPETVPETEAASSYVTTTTLNVRSGPSTNDRILVQLAPGTAVNVIQMHNDEWAVIQTGEQEGYVARQYLAPAETPAETTAQ